MWLIWAKSALLMYICQQGNEEENSVGGGVFILMQI